MQATYANTTDPYYFGSSGHAVDDYLTFESYIRFNTDTNNFDIQVRAYIYTINKNNFPSVLSGNSTFTINGTKTTLTINESSGTWSTKSGIYPYYFYQDFDITSNLPAGIYNFTWYFPTINHTFTDTIDVNALLKGKTINYINNYYDYNPNNFNDSDIKPSIELGSLYSYTEFISKLEFGLNLIGSGTTPDVIAFQELENFKDRINDAYKLTYTFNPTEDELNILRNESSTGYYVYVYYLVRFTLFDGSTTIVKSKMATCEIQGEEDPPTMAPTVVDVNTSTVKLTGDSSKLIKFMSNVRYTVNGYAGTNSTISSQYVMNNSIKYEGDTGLITNIENGVFKFVLENNKGSIITQSITLDMVPYVKLTCNNVYCYPPDPETGDVYFKVKGNCYKGSFGASDNALTVQYRYKLSTDTAYIDWVDIPAANITRYDGPANYWEASGTIPSLDYTQTYQVQIRAVDSLAAAATPIMRLTTTPVFDWSKNDFKTNVPTIINGWTYGSNALLWEGESQMGDGATIYLNQPIQYVPHGIVLVFSAADDDVSWSSHFVPKEMININQGGGQTFIMANNTGMSIIGAKYLYIYDDMIKGHIGNSGGTTTHESTSSITTTSNHFVLRYVYGV